MVELKRTEESLRESEKRFRSLVETTSDWIWEVDENAVYTYVSPKIFSILGYEPEEVIGKTPFDLMPLDEARRIADIFNPLTAKHKPFMELENANLHKDGHLVILETSGVPFFDGKGVFRGYRGIDRDITKRKKAQKETKLAYAELDQIFNTAADGMRLIDKNFNVLRINKTLCNMSGIEKDKAVGKKCYETFRGTFCHTSNCPLTRILRGEEHVEYDVEKERNDGTKITCIVTATPFSGSHGELIGIVEDFKDITERKQAKEAIELAYREINQIFNTADGGMCVIDKDFNILRINDILCRLLGISKDEAVGKKCHEIFHDHFCGTPNCPLTRILNGEDNIVCNFELSPQDGACIPCILTATAFRGTDGKLIGIVENFKDISKLKKIEEELQKAKKLESLGTLAGGIAHDFNNLLTAIIGNLSLLEIYAQSGENISEVLEETNRACRQTKYLTKQLLTFAKGGEPIKKKASLSILLKDTITLALSGSNVSCKFSIPNDLWLVEIDEGQIRQAFNNLIINADQAMPRGGRIEVCAENVTVKTKDILPIGRRKICKNICKRSRDRDT